jgi:NAD(P)-dependent dehydrogenase (short-subunit alcohol dehydrogenase family)
LSDPKAETDATEPDHSGTFRLDRQASLITGAGFERGIGREIGLAYAAAGASVGLADVDEDSVRSAARAVQAAGGEAPDPDHLCYGIGTEIASRRIAPDLRKVWSA